MEIYPSHFLNICLRLLLLCKTVIWLLLWEVIFIVNLLTAVSGMMMIPDLLLCSSRLQDRWLMLNKLLIIVWLLSYADLLVVPLMTHSLNCLLIEAHFGARTVMNPWVLWKFRLHLPSKISWLHETWELFLFLTISICLGLDVIAYPLHL
jgi:hypothetical protein